MVADAANGLTRWYRGLICCLMLLAPSAWAVDELQLQMQRISGIDWTLDGLEVKIAAAPEDRAIVSLGAAVLRVAGQEIRQILLVCPEAGMDMNHTLVCDKGNLEIGASPFNAVTGGVSWQYLDANHWSLKLEGLHFSRAGLKLQLTYDSGRLGARFSLQNFNLQLLHAWFPPGWTFGGSAAIEGDWVFKDGALSAGNAQMRLKDFSYSSEDGLQVGEALSLSLKLEDATFSKEWQGKLGLQISQGQLYADPFFVEISREKPVEIDLQGMLDADVQRLELTRLSFNYGDWFSGKGAMTVRLSAPEVRELDLAFQVADLTQAYGTLVQPLVIGSALDDMSITGRAHGRVKYSAAELQGLSLALKQVQLEQNAGLFGLAGLAAEIQWQRSEGQQPSWLRWDSGHLFKVDFGALEAGFTAHAGNIIVQPLTLPVLDGQLRLQDLQLNGLLDGNPGWQARAGLKDIQLGILSRSLGWPELSGGLQASIPRLHYQDALLKMDGELLVDVFGGKVVVDGLQFEDPLGVAPVLETSVRLLDLDLEQVTQVFDFGRIQGSLEGYIHDLQLVGWQVTQFDANLQSPLNDRRPHRISQRAIDNLTELGNGASVNLSATMLRFFEDFAYDRLALKIRLHGAVAELDGVPNPKGGYYIVKGARLPRIDVIGRNHRVAWKDMLSRIRDIRFDDMIVE